MPITIGSNIASLKAQRELSKGTDALAKVYERLSSGLRINRASDDAAGLAIASSLNMNARVYRQGVRNLIDGISVMNIAEGALNELSNIVIRLKELAEQSANGTLSTKQRTSLDTEAQALSDEYFRIARTTTFNGLNLFDGSVQGLNLQAGVGNAAVLQSSLGGKLGTGNFSTAATVGTGNLPAFDAIGDLNGDGILDIAVTSQSNVVSVLLGTGNGTFMAKTDYATGTGLDHVALGDVNGDGVLDLVTTNNTAGTTSVLIGVGDGTFKAKTDYGNISTPVGLDLGDVNGDGALDIVAQANGGTTVAVLLGNGNGSFKAQSNFTSSATPFDVTLGDVNADGLLDIVSTGGGGGASAASVLLGNGDGSFKAKVDYTTGNSPRGSAITDFNGDGAVDLVTANWLGGTVSVLLGNGNGTFKANVDYTTGANCSELSTGDLNGDGVIDVVTANWGTGKVSVLLGNGDGTFMAKTDLTSGSFTTGVDIGDLNGDGVLDIAAANAGSNNIAVFLATTRDGVAPLLEFSLKTRADALQAMSIFENALNNLTTQRSTIGANQSRLDVATSILSVSADNFTAAEGRIRDADIAQESSELVRRQILQQAAVSILAQANQSPALVLQLLNGR